MIDATNRAPRTARKPPIAWGLVVAATVVATAAIALIWLAAVPWGPVVCPAIYPMPTNCIPEYRVGTALIMTLVISAIYLATTLAAVIGRRARGLVITGVVLLAIALVASYLVIAWAPGFPI